MVHLIAELSCNHGGSIKKLIDLIEAAKKSNCWACKLQLYTPEDLCLKEANIIANGKWEGKTLHQIYTEGQTPQEWHRIAFSLANEIGLNIFSSPFSLDAVDFLESIGCCMYKVASGEIKNKEMLKLIAQTKKPVFISTGMATEQDIENALSIIDYDQVVLMKCTSEYPAPLDHCNLITIMEMKNKYGLDVGLSDHSINGVVPIMAVAYGATYIEKHMKLTPYDNVLDASFSLTPTEMWELNHRLQDAERAIGVVKYDGINDKNKLYMKSVWVKADVKKGEKLTRDNTCLVRPGMGVDAWSYENILGEVARMDIKANTPLLTCHITEY